MKKTILYLVLASFVILLCGCGKKTEINKYVERTPGEAVSYTGSDYVKVASGDNSELYINPKTITVKWVDKKTGEYKETRVFDDAVTDSTLKNDIIISYFTGTESNIYASTSNMDTYTYCVSTEGNVSYEKIDNGVRILYVLANDKVSYKDFPAYISDERMQELIISKLDDKQLKTLKKQYRQLKSGDWSRTSNKDNPLAGLSATALYKLFYEECGYTYEDLEYDNAEHDKLDEMPQRQHIELAVDYYLDGDDFMVHVDTAQILSNDDFPIKSLSVLPYFLSSNSDDGYLFIPDGSGALLYFDNLKTKEFQFTSRYWNGDVLQTSGTYSTTNAYMTAPVYGIKEGNTAILGIIEEGAEICTLSAYIPKSFNNIPYSRASLSFAIREDQTLANYSDATTKYTLKRTGDDYYAGDITIRYKFLSGDKANYAGMAEAYKEQLLKNGALAKCESEDEAPVFVELLGCIDATKYFLGIPYNGTTTITDFESATEILSDMNERGIGNIIVDYVGMANGGMLQRSAEKVSIESKLGGKSGFKKFLEYANSINARVYPNFQLQTANTEKGLSKEERVFIISGEIAQIYDFSLVSQTALTDSDFPTYIVNPAYIKDYIAKFSKSYNKLGVSNLASEDFFTFISPNYKKDENLSITSALPLYTEALDKLSENYSLMLSNPLSLAWKDVDYIADLPSDGLNLKVMDTYVPFIQMVLSGNVTYSTEVLNTNSYNMEEELLKTMEYGAAPKFRFIGESASVLEKTEADDVFLAEYDKLAETVEGLYKEYSEFYEDIKGAYITDHELLTSDGKVAKTTWSNGTVFYVNYTDEAVKYDGVTISAKSYTIKTKAGR
ncbi:MAG: hypothetical protein K6B75_04230 [Lachnospiraceae bacterium]|nr:hypothetical protein [Lachnospiraceae bacterium]